MQTLISKREREFDRNVPIQTFRRELLDDGGSATAEEQVKEKQYTREFL